MSSFETLGHLLKLPPFSAQKCHSAGGRGAEGSPNFLLLIGILIFLLLRSPRKILEPYDNPFLDFSSRVCARETLRSAPHHTSRNFPAHMSAESPSNISPNPFEVISEVSEP
jgi:hypothetical protein